jgi:hypothetical protein
MLLKNSAKRDVPMVPAKKKVLTHQKAVAPQNGAGSAFGSYVWWLYHIGFVQAKHSDVFYPSEHI